MFRKCLITAVGLIAVLPLAVWAQPLADQVPNDAIVYVGWAGAAHVGESYEGSHLKAVVEQSEWEDFFTRFLPQVMQKAGQGDREAAEASQFLAAVARPMWKHPTAFYFGGVDFTNPRQPVPRIAFLCNAGDDAPAMQRTLTDALAKARRRPNEPQTTITTQEGLVTVTIGAPLAGGVPTLSASEAIKLMARHAHKQPVFLAYVDGERLLKFADEATTHYAAQHDGEAATKWPQLRDALGLSGFKGLLVTGGFNGKNWSTFAHVRAPAGQRTGLLKFLDNKPLSREIVTSIPETAVLASAGSFDIAALMDEIRDGGTKVSPDFAQNYGAVMGYLGGMVGVELRDLVEPLGNEWAAYVDPTVAGTSPLGMTIINRLDDPAKARDLLTKAERGINVSVARQLRNQKFTIQFKQAKRDGVDVHYLALPVITPAWAIEGDKLFVGFFPQSVVGAVVRSKQGGKSLLDNPAFVAMRNELGDQGASAISFLDVPKLAPQGYASWVMVSRYAGFGDLFGIDSPLMLLPPLYQLSDHLIPAGSVQWSDDEGWYSRSISAFPGSEALATDPVSSFSTLQPAVMASILLPSLNRARETANRVKSASNLRMIGQGLLLYANENRGRYPATQGELVTTQDMPVTAFVNPRSDTSLPPQIAQGTPQAQAEWVNANSDYVYKGAGKNNQVAPDAVVAYERPEGLSDGINILFGDGHVEFVLMKDAMRMIAE